MKKNLVLMLLVFTGLQAPGLGFEPGAGQETGLAQETGSVETVCVWVADSSS